MSPNCSMMTDTTDAAAPGGDEPHQRPPAARSCEVEILNTSGRKLDLSWIESNLHKALPLLPEPIARLAVRIVDDAAMRDLNRRHHSTDGTTDVLTFPNEADDAAHRGLDVDIAICADEAFRRAAELNHRLERELLLYIIHGLLHCAGFDDAEPAAAARMHAEEDRILRSIGVGATYEAGP